MQHVTLLIWQARSGFGADEVLAEGARRIATVQTEQLQGAEKWTMPFAPDARLAAVTADFPTVARKAVIVPLPTVPENPSTNAGFLQVVVADIDLWALP